MDDRFLNEMRREPRPEFARSLRDRLLQVEAADEARRGFRLHPALAGALAVACVALAFTLPSVRAAAQSMLDLFRVRNFAAVPFDATRLQALQQRVNEAKENPALIVFDRTEVVREPGPPREFVTAQAAEAAAGIPVRTPSFLPRGLALTKSSVQDEGIAKLTLDGGKVERLLSDLDVHDVNVPHQFDGQTITVRMPTAVNLHYTSASRDVELMQAESPEVSLPPGANLSEVGEIALRVLGLSPGEARRIAGSIDWRTTMLVPLPMDATTYHEVTVHGAKALLITSTGKGRMEGQRGRDRNLLVWSEGGRVYALAGNLSDQEFVEMAESVH